MRWRCAVRRLYQIVFAPIRPALVGVLLGDQALLLALLAGPTQVLWVALLYLGIQLVETYLVEPLIERRTAALPPALTLLAQVGLGALLGGLGVVLAAPLTAAALVLVRRLYVEDVLGEG